MTPDIPPQAITAVYDGPGGRLDLSPEDITDILEAAAPHLAAAEREACAQLAGSLKFTLYRPRNGPGAGQEALDVVPLGELLGHLRKDDHARD